VLDVDKLPALRAVAASGSIAAAARGLGYTRSAVSQQISSLERAAKTAVLRRGGNKVVVTPTGRILLEHTERILAEVRAAEAAVRIGDGRVVGELRVGVAFREGPPLMSSALTGVRRRHPGLQVTLAATPDGTGADEVRRGHLDLVIMSRFGADAGAAGPGRHQVVVGRDPLRLCVPDHHRLAGAAACPVSELAAEPWVLGPATPLSRLVVGLCAFAGFEPPIAATRRSPRAGRRGLGGHHRARLSRNPPRREPK
jgi:DNA-binding transcriptional LysR family regulator